MKFKRVIAVTTIAASALAVGACGDDDDDDDVIEETVPGNPDLDPGAGTGLPGDEGDEGTTG